MKTILKDKLAEQVLGVNFEIIETLAEASVYMDKGCIFECDLLAEIDILKQGLRHVARDRFRSSIGIDELKDREEAIIDGGKLGVLSHHLHVFHERKKRS